MWRSRWVSRIVSGLLCQLTVRRRSERLVDIRTVESGILSHLMMGSEQRAALPKSSRPHRVSEAAKSQGM